jgi:hypothetical protein
MTADIRLLLNTAQKLKDGIEVKNIDIELIKQIAIKTEDHESMPPIILVGEDIFGKKVLV